MKKSAMMFLMSISVLMIAVLAVNALAFEGIKAVFPQASITGDFPEEEKEKALPIREINTNTKIPAQQAIDSIMKYEPSSVEGWRGGKPNDGTPASIYSWVCGALEGKNIPHPVVANSKSYTEGNRSNFTTIIAYAYGAGEGATAVKKLKEQASSCKGAGGLSSSTTPVKDSENGFSAYYSSGGKKRVNVNMWAVGDVVLSVSSTSFSSLINTTQEVNRYARGLLSPICLVFDTTEKDLKRNPYVDAENYTGWEKGREVLLNRNIAGLNPGIVNLETPVVGRSYALGAIPGKYDVGLLTEVPGKTLEWNKVDIPDAPLAPYPDILPDAVDEPLNKPKELSVPEVETVVSERVRDDDGPGCGWSFTGQASPQYDDEAEKKAADEREQKAQTAMQTEQKEFYNLIADYVEKYEAYALSVKAYKDYVEEVDEVREKWDEINRKRDDYRRKLDAYYQAIDDRKNFLERQKDAREKYEDDLEICETYNDEMDDYEEALEKDRARYDRERDEWREEKMKEQEERNRGNQNNNPDGDELDDGATAEPSPTPTPVPTDPGEPPADEVKPVGEDLTKPSLPDGVSCPVNRPVILDQAPPAYPSVPKKPDVALPDAWTDIPDEG